MGSTFNTRLVMLLKQKKLSQKEAAARVGVTEAAMSHYLKGDRMPRTSVLVRIAEALGTTTDYLTGGDSTNPNDEYNCAKRLIARNVHQMSKEEKMEIINILLEES